MGFFDDSHVTDVGLQGSLGPSVGFGEMVSQGYRQQFRVDSALAMNNELQNRWMESLRRAQLDDGLAGSDESWAYMAMAQYVQNRSIDVNESPSLDVLLPGIGPISAAKTIGSYIIEPDREARIKSMIETNEAIKKLNNPEIKSFEQILEEVSQMQHEVESETASMYERTSNGGFLASMLGAMAGSFTTRDPLNLITAPIGIGRTAVTRIATDMALAGTTVGVTEVLQVAPARRIAGLPERDPLLNIAAATLGAGVIRGGIEGIGYGVGRLRGESIDFDLRDSQLAQMFEANVEKPSARAGLSILNDTRFIERNNPYGEGRAAQERFLAELQSVQRAMNAEPMTAVARVLPPVPFEQLKKVADFEIVREQAPQVYARMEAAQAKLRFVTNKSEIVGPIPVEGLAPANIGLDGRIYVGEMGEAHFHVLERYPEIEWGGKVGFVNPEGQFLSREKALEWVNSNGERIRPAENMEGELDALDYRDQSEFVPPPIYSTRRAAWDKEAAARTVARQAANGEYEAAYRAVEAEAAAINARQQVAQAAQQNEAVSIIASEGLPFTGPLLRHDGVESLVEQINKFNDTLDERTAARFVRETLGEGDNKVEVEVWEKDGGIDIGLKDPVDPNFTFVTDEGEMTVAAAMRDLQDDTDLVEVIKGCAI